MSAIEEGEFKFVGSLDCGTTSTRFIIFDERANIIAQSQQEYTQHYPNPGWHEQDASELQAVCDNVIEQAIAKLEEAGYSRKCVKVIGASFDLPRMCPLTDVEAKKNKNRCHQSTRDNRCVESQNGQAARTRDRVGRHTYPWHRDAL